jgi:uncharacterized protein (DUF2062 family)
VKVCIVIPCYNHPATVAKVVRAASAHCAVFVVDDGSTVPLPEMPGTLVRLPRNQGKGAALRAGFRRAFDDGFTHAITMDADDQHSADDLPKFLEAAATHPDALIVGIRDFFAAACPTHRRRSNAVSTFWFRVETGVRLGDTQCGFRCYPLALTQKVRARSERYAFELEFMVRAAWIGVPIISVPVVCTYRPEQIRQSHFRPVVDLARITTMNIRLVLQSWCVPRSVRTAWSLGRRHSPAKVARDFFAEHAHNPARLAFAVGLGLFCGIIPIWGFQMLVAAAIAHLLRLNKAIALLASNISIPPAMPFILYAGLALGHRMFTGTGLDFSPQHMTRARAMEYLGEWCIGSVVLGALVAAGGMLATYSVARLLQSSRNSANT